MRTESSAGCQRHGQRDDDKRHRSEAGTTLRNSESGAELRAAFATGSPECTDDDFTVIERVIEMGGDSPEVHASDARDGRVRVERSSAWKSRDDLQGLFKFFGEDLGMLAILEPPGFLELHMLLRCVREANAPMLQRDRSSRRMTSASISRPALTSSSESRNARCNAARSSAVSQSPGSRGRSSTSVPSGRSVGSSTTSRPAFTRAVSVMSTTVAPGTPRNKVP